MAYIEKFVLENFKGIEKTTINMRGKNNCPVITLVGLNESGKTTILEALSHFVTSIGTVSEEKLSDISGNYLSLVPIVKKANFIGSVKITATVVLEEQDIESIVKIFTRANRVVERESIRKSFDITRSYVFNEGAFVKLSNTWNFNLNSKTKQAKNYKSYKRPTDVQVKNGAQDLWLKCVNRIENSLPVIAYFPTFLVDIPDKIYLSKTESEHPSQRYYRQVLQDVLDSLEEGLDIDRHIVDRIKKHQDEESVSALWLSLFFGKPEKGLVDSVVQKISNTISREVIGSWQNIFNRPISAKFITLDWQVDLENEATPYLSFGISDGESKYLIHERSLGFRWFFLFLLFTRFKTNRIRPTLFLFDEPAANLHARAQMELLKSFGRIIANSNRIVYSTHSPHMINPEWISAAFIVENAAINYDSEADLLNFSSPPTSIRAISYRDFVSQSPERTTYFQPILENLQHSDPFIAPDDIVLVTEGITDYHAFLYYAKDILEERGVNLLPGMGDTNHDTQIAILISKATKFLVILDDDKSGRLAAARYRERWYLSSENISTIGEVFKPAAGKKLETLLSKKTIVEISNHMNLSRKPRKREIGLFFAEAIHGLALDNSPDTRRLVRDILNAAISHMLQPKTND